MKLPAVTMLAAALACGGPPQQAEQASLGTGASRLAQAVCPGGATIRIDSSALDNPATSLTGLYVTVQQDGTTLASGWTPFTASDLCAGQQYTITAADYRNYRFTRWEDGTATSFRRVTVEPTAVYTASYQVGGSIAPLYSWPVDETGAVSSTWTAAAAAHQSWPQVALIAVVNNQNGPGPAADAAWMRGIGVLAGAGCMVAGYVYTQYGQRTLSAVEADIASWRTWYPQVTALFLDQMSNTTGQEGYYAALTSFARSQGFELVIGNAGAPTVPSYVGTVDTIVIHESTTVASSFAAWQASYSPNDFATLTYGFSAPLPDAQITANKSSVAYQYVTNDGIFPDANPWDAVSSYLDAVLELLAGP
jgi:hypothetical protein